MTVSVSPEPPNHRQSAHDQYAGEMSDPRQELTTALIQKLDLLRPRQLLRVNTLVEALIEGADYWVDTNSDFATEDFAQEFGDQLRLHHNASLIPLTKDKFEYAFVDALNDSGYTARKLPNGNPGEDIIVNGSPWSLKTQADRLIKRDFIHISKFMELGKGQWETEEDIQALRARMFAHMTAYERIFSLRCLSKDKVAGVTIYDYELVEIPKALLLKADGQPIEIKVNSRQNPKPASCYVHDEIGQAFELYFDGGTERKLQVKALAKRNCQVHATWKISIPE